MCIGIPMRVVEARDNMAVCEGMGERREINMQLVGDQPVGRVLGVPEQVRVAAQIARLEEAGELGPRGHDVSMRPPLVREALEGLLGRGRAISEGGVGAFAEFGTGGFGDEVSAAGNPMPPLDKGSRGLQPHGDPVAHSAKAPAPPVSQQY